MPEDSASSRVALSILGLVALCVPLFVPYAMIEIGAVLSGDSIPQGWMVVGFFSRIVLAPIYFPAAVLFFALASVPSPSKCPSRRRFSMSVVLATILLFLPVFVLFAVPPIILGATSLGPTRDGIVDIWFGGLAILTLGGGVSAILLLIAGLIVFLIPIKGNLKAPNASAK